MALRTQKTIGVLITIICFYSLAAGQPRWSADARHDHTLGDCSGRVTVDETGVSYESKEHSWIWSYDDIQQLRAERGRLTLVTYQDGGFWKLGIDREFHFRITGEDFIEQTAKRLRDQLGPRFVAAFPDEIKPAWELPVKLLGVIRGSQGRLIVGDNSIVFQTQELGRSRTWTYDDIVRISSRSAYHFTIVTHEKQFEFQLKRPLQERLYDDLWLTINKTKLLRD